MESPFCFLSRSDDPQQAVTIIRLRPPALDREVAVARCIQVVESIEGLVE